MAGALEATAEEVELVAEDQQRAHRPARGRQALAARSDALAARVSSGLGRRRRDGLGAATVQAARGVAADRPSRSPPARRTRGSETELEMAGTLAKRAADRRQRGSKG
jgi:hypothetical protein